MPLELSFVDKSQVSLLRVFVPCWSVPVCRTFTVSRLGCVKTEVSVVGSWGIWYVRYDCGRLCAGLRALSTFDTLVTAQSSEEGDVRPHRFGPRCRSRRTVPRPGSFVLSPARTGESLDPDAPFLNGPFVEVTPQRGTDRKPEVQVYWVRPGGRTYRDSVETGKRDWCLTH